MHPLNAWLQSVPCGQAHGQPDDGAQPLVQSQIVFPWAASAAQLPAGGDGPGPGEGPGPGGDGPVDAIVTPRVPMSQRFSPALKYM